MSARGNARPENRYLPVDLWPEGIGRAWLRARTGVNAPFREDGGGKRPNAVSLGKYESGLARYFGFLHRDEGLSRTAALTDLISRERMDRYFQHLQACGNADYTIASRFDELRAALRLMNLAEELPWFAGKNAASVRKVLPMRRRQTVWIDSAEGLVWAQDLFHSGRQQTSSRQRCVQIRDAVLIGILATLAPRRRSLALLQVGLHLHRQDEEWLILLTTLNMKEGNPMELPLPNEVGVMLDRYLAVERRDLLRSLKERNSDALERLWLTWNGRAMCPLQLSAMIQARSKTRYGVALGPHSFRTALATKQVRENPGNALDSAAILGNGPQIAMKHYNRAKGIEAARRHSQHIRELRLATQHFVR